MQDCLQKKGLRRLRRPAPLERGRGIAISVAPALVGVRIAQTPAKLSGAQVLGAFGRSIG
jgi:hypothetical protein